MLHYALRGELEPDVVQYARDRCAGGDCVIRRSENGRIVIGFANEDRAYLFLNLFDDEIDESLALDRTSASGATQSRR